MPLYLGKQKINIKNVQVNCCRLLIRKNDSNIVHLPKECLFAKDFILNYINYHNQFYPKNKNCFIYLTIRTTEKDCYYKNSCTWHVDGFQGAKIDRHIPEQGIIWSNVNPTEFLMQPFYLAGLDSAKHDIHDYLNKNGNEGMAYKGVENGVYLITPYNVHRACEKNINKKRVLIRINFSPVEIQDYTNTDNPMLPMKYNYREDIRDHLWSYDLDETKVNGFVKM